MRKITKLEPVNPQPVKRKRVAAYARVSSGKDAQLHSLSAQISYYNRYIGSRGDWELVGIYADSAMTGTKTDRPEFQRLLSDCRAGKIDMVIAKSITRLARNTVTLLETARELKDLEIDIYFEKENIHTLSSDGELMLTLLASFAQEESRSASENVKWRIRKNFEKGIPTAINMLGYKLVDGKLYVVPEEAEIVKRIFEDFLSGSGKIAIAKKLNHQGIPSPTGGLWQASTIRDILQNEKYMGSLLLQKTYRKDHITKKRVLNRGELPQYYVANAHEAIIDQDTFMQVQQEMKERKSGYFYTTQPHEPYLFNGLLRCKLCGKRFHRKYNNKNTKYEKAIWVCSTYNNLGKEFCPSGQIPEDILIAKTSEILGHDDWNREELLENIAEIIVPEHNYLIYVFRDGHTQGVYWQNPSRRESWTPEMKQRAKEHQLAIQANKQEEQRKEEEKIVPAPKRTVRKIESQVSLLPNIPTAAQKKKRVAAYARVSTDSDEQLSSYAAQVDFYTQYIKNNPEWEFVAVYTDEGISGTNTKKREGFNRMIGDALAGKIDLILTKSISRFARNTVDTLTTIRKLKEKNIEVYFEKENIYTLDAKGEVMITIMSSLAQEESRSISENITWGKRKSMADGKVTLAYKHFLGYEKGEDGLPKIVEEEAKVVRKIYELFLDGYTVRMIADYLTEQGIPTPMQKTKWSVSTIMSILTNEKYKGDALLQKTYTADFLSKKIKKNQGEIPQYYIENSHPAIISPEMFELVQNELARRRPVRHQLHRNSPFTAKIICGDCGKYYGRKVWHSSSKHQKYIWRCNRKYDTDIHCSTPNLSEEEIAYAFVKAFNQILKDKERYIAQFRELLPILADSSDLEAQLKETQEKHTTLLASLRSYMEENTRQVQDQTEYNKHFSEMHEACESMEKRCAELQRAILAQTGRKEQLNCFLDKLQQCGDIIKEFDPELWNLAVESVTVSPSKTLTFRFYDGTEVPVKLADEKMS